MVFAITAVPFLVQQIRQGLHPAHEQTWTAMSYESSLANLESQSVRTSYHSSGGDEWTPAKRAAPMPKEQAVEEAESAPGFAGLKDEDKPAAAPKPAGADGKAGRRAHKGRPYDLEGPAPQAMPQVQQARKSKLNVQDYAPNPMVQTGPGLPAWTWRNPLLDGASLRAAFYRHWSRVILAIVPLARVSVASPQDAPKASVSVLVWSGPLEKVVVTLPLVG